MADIQFNVVVQDQNSTPIQNARVVVLTEQLSGRARHTDGGGFANFYSGPTLTTPITFDVMVDAGGFQPFCTDANQGTSITLGPSSVTLTAKLAPSFKLPTRDRVCSVGLKFQGLTVNSTQFGQLPWFDAALFSLQPGDRAQLYPQLRSAGNTHAIIGYTSRRGDSIYNEPGQPYQQMTDPGFELDDAAFSSAVREVLSAGLVPMVFLDGDNGQLGYATAVKQLPNLARALGSLYKYVLVSPGWDGVFYGYTPQQLFDFGAQFRSFFPDGHLAVEHQPGRIPAGGGPGDWLPTGGMATYDVLLSEFMDGNLHQDSTWQVGGRVLGPAYIRPNEQPSGDDPNPPFYFASGNPRGAYYSVAFEYYEYEWVRSLVTASQVENDRNYLKSLGWRLAC